MVDVIAETNSLYILLQMKVHERMLYSLLWNLLKSFNCHPGVRQFFMFVFRYCAEACLYIWLIESIEFSNDFLLKAVVLGRIQREWLVACYEVAYCPSVCKTETDVSRQPIL
jgi:hypothetical protein